MEKSIRVRILGRDYPLIVREEDEQVTREIASYVDTKMRAFKKSHPEQSELTAAVITALALTEEIRLLRSEKDDVLFDLEDLAQQLDAVLPKAGFVAVAEELAVPLLDEEEDGGGAA